MYKTKIVLRCGFDSPQSNTSKKRCDIIFSEKKTFVSVMHRATAHISVEWGQGT